MIDYILSFIVEHWFVFIPCFLGIIEFIFLMIFKKRPEVIANDITKTLVDLCHDAEVKFGKGQGVVKLNYVLDKFKAILGNNYVYFEAFIKREIEAILGCQSK